jgi:hypothetical protein
MFPTSQQFFLDFTTVCLARTDKRLSPGFQTQLTKVFTLLFVEEFPPVLPPSASRSDRLKLKIAYPEKAYHLFLRVCCEAFIAFVENAAPILVTPPASDSIFSQQRRPEKELLNGASYEDLDHAYDSGAFRTYAALAEPFKDRRQELSAAGLFDWDNASPKVLYFVDEREPGNFSDEMGIDWINADKATRAEWQRKSDRYHKADRKAHDAAFQETYGRLSAIETSLLQSPLFPYAHYLTPVETTYFPFEIPQETRYSGMWIIAPPKRGKTTLLTSLFWEDLKLVANSKASIVVLDSKGDLIDTIKNLAIFAQGGSMYGKLVLIEPDPDHPLALNPLDLSDGTDANLTPGQRKMLANRSVTLLEYLFATMLDGEAGMSGPQSRFFRACMRAILEVIPNPTLHTFYDLLINGYEKYEQYISKLEDRSFFSKEQFYSSTLKATRDSLITRLGLLLDNYAIASMFKSFKTRLNLAREMDSAKVIIINNSKALLEDNGAEFFGRFFLYLLRKAAERRTPGADHMPVFCYIDEAHNVIKRDENIATIVQECRSKNIGMIFAHQALSQIDNDKVRGALADCAIIFANSAAEASQLAPRLNAETPEMLKQPVGTFAAYVRDTADNAVPLKIRMPPDLLLMDQRQREQIRLEMRDAYCADRANQRHDQYTDASQQEDVSADEPDNTPDANFDLHWTITISPRTSEQGGKVKISNRLTVTIPSGTANGEVLRVKSRGAPKPDGTQGHLFLHIRVPARPAQPGIGASTDRREEWS